MPEITDLLLANTADSFQQSVDDAFNQAPDNGSKIAVLKNFYDSLNRFSREWKSNIPNAATMANEGCPAGWNPCPDGSCVPPGVDCGGGLNFANDTLILNNQGIADNQDSDLETQLTIDQAKDFLSAYLKHAASTYFEAASGTELKQKTRELLDEALSKFRDSLG